MRRDGPSPPRERENAVSINRLTVIWTPADLRQAATQLRALGAPERDDVAPVIDIRTRKVIG